MAVELLESPPTEPTSRCGRDVQRRAALREAAARAGRETFGQRLRRLRLLRGWNRTELEERTGINRFYVFLLEDDRRRNPNLETLRALSAVLSRTGSLSVWDGVAWQVGDGQE